MHALSVPTFCFFSLGVPLHRLSNPQLPLELIEELLLVLPFNILSPPGSDLCSVAWLMI